MTYLTLGKLHCFDTGNGISFLQESFIIYVPGSSKQ